MFIICKYTGYPLISAHTFQSKDYRLTNKYESHPIFSLDINQLNRLAEHHLEMSDEEKHIIFCAYLKASTITKFDSYLNPSIYSISTPVFVQLVKIVNYFQSDDCLIQYFPEFRIDEETTPEQLDTILDMWTRQQRKQMYLFAEKKRDNLKRHQESIAKKIVSSATGLRPLGEKLVEYACKWLEWGADCSDIQIKYVKKVLETERKNLTKLNTALAKQSRGILIENLPETNEEMRIKKMIIVKHIDMCLDSLARELELIGDVKTDIVVVVNNHTSYAIKTILEDEPIKSTLPEPKKADYATLGEYLKAMAIYRSSRHAT